jgi:hypothetical protein
VTAAALPDRVTLKLGAYARLNGGNVAQRTGSGLLALPFMPAIALFLLRFYLTALVFLVVAVVGVIAFMRLARPAAKVTAFADAAGIHWYSGGPASVPWERMDWVELGNNQPGGKLIAAMGMNTGNVRTGDYLTVTVVSGGTPYEVMPVRGAGAASRKAFGEGVAALARAHGVRVRVLTLGWGTEDANCEAPQLG